MANKFWIGGTGNWDGTTGSSAHWASTTGGTGPVAGPGTGDVALFDNLSGGGTVTVTGDIAIQGLVLTSFTGTLDFSANNNNITLSTNLAFVDTATNAHVLNMGNGVWTCSANSSTPWSAPTSTNLTLNCNSSTLRFSATNANASARFGAKTYNAVEFTGAGSFWTAEASNGTMATLSIAAGIGLQFGSGITWTVNTAPTFVGTRAAPILLGTISTTTGTLNVPSGAVTLDWGILNRIAGTGASSTFTATNTVGYGTNTGWTISSGPSAGGSSGVVGG